MAAKKVYEKQQLVLTLHTYIDLSSEVGNTAILIRSPDGTISQVAADIVAPPTIGDIFYTFPVGVLMTGDYTAQALLVTQNIPGESFSWHVYELFN